MHDVVWTRFFPTNQFVASNPVLANHYCMKKHIAQYSEPGVDAEVVASVRKDRSRERFCGHESADSLVGIGSDV